MSLRLSIFLFLIACSQIAAEAGIDAPAPDFQITDARGKIHSLTDYRGKWLVLEWTNKDCPFVKKHYESKNMQTLQEKYEKKGVAWLTVISSAPGKQGYLTATEALSHARKVGSQAMAILLDPQGKMGRAYGAKTTPHMYVIDPGGRLVYMGAIDSRSTSKASDIPGSENYVALALDAGMAGKSIKTKSTRAYGCSVKY